MVRPSGKGDLEGFSGHRGFVEDPEQPGTYRKLTVDRGTKGRVDPGDQLSEPVPADDPKLQAAIEDFRAKYQTLSAMNHELEGLSKGLKRGESRPNQEQWAKMRQLAERTAELTSGPNAPHLRVGARLVEAGARGLIADATGLTDGKKARGQEAFNALKGAIDDDPQSLEARRAYAISMTHMVQQWWYGKIEDTLGFEFRVEVPRAIEGLRPLRDDLISQSILYVLVDSALRDGDFRGDLAKSRQHDQPAMWRDYRALRQDLVERLPALMRANPEDAQKVHEILAEVVEDLSPSLVDLDPNRTGRS